MLREVHPVLPCQDVASSIEFYVHKLGFTLVFQDADDPGYAGVRRDCVELHLQWHDSKEWERVKPHQVVRRFKNRPFSRNWCGHFDAAGFTRDGESLISLVPESYLRHANASSR